MPQPALARAGNPILPPAPAPKLRNTCNPCAAAKVGCSKEKPTCFRCANRGLACAYSATKRAGRTSHSNRQAAAAVTLGGESSMTAARDISTQTNMRHSPPNTSDFANAANSASTPMASPTLPPLPSLVHVSSSEFSLSPSFPDRFATLLSTPHERCGEAPVVTTSPTNFDDLLAGTSFFSSDKLPMHGDAYGEPTLGSHGRSNFLQGLEDMVFDDFGDYGDENFQISMNEMGAFDINKSGDSNDNGGHVNIASGGGLMLGQETALMNGNIGSSAQSSDVDPRLVDNRPTSSSAGQSSVSLFPGSTHTATTALPSSRTSAQSTHNSSLLSSRRLSPEGSHFPVAAETHTACESDPSHRYLAQALALLPQFSLNPVEACVLSAVDLSAGQKPDFERVISQNEAAVDSIRKTLENPGASDGYILVILSLAIFSILTSYTTVSGGIKGGGAQSHEMSSQADWQQHHPHKPVEQQNSTSASTHTSGGEVQQRIAAQLILSKLSAVQQLVNMLSKRLQEFSAEALSIDARQTSSNMHMDPAEQGSSHGHRDLLLRPLSAKLAHTLEADMRRGLRQISRGIIDKLRRE